MARLPRLYLVECRHLNGKVETRRYQSPEAAEERRERFAQGDPQAVVTVTPSYPVIYPMPNGDPDRLKMPDSLITRDRWNELAAHLGIAPEPITAITISADEITVQYQPDPRREPLLWHVEIIEESKS